MLFLQNWLYTSMKLVLVGDWTMVKKTRIWVVKWHITRLMFLHCKQRFQSCTSSIMFHLRAKLVLVLEPPRKKHYFMLLMTGIISWTVVSQWPQSFLTFPKPLKGPTQSTHLYFCQQESGPLLAWFCSYLSNRSQRVVLDGHSSTIHAVTSRVPRWSILGPQVWYCMLMT